MSVEPDSNADVSVVCARIDPATPRGPSERATTNNCRTGWRSSFRGLPFSRGPLLAARPLENPPLAPRAQVGETLTVDTSAIADTDGMTGAAFSYRWLADGADIAGTTGVSYTRKASTGN